MCGEQERDGMGVPQLQPMKQLHIAPRFSLPLEAVTQSIGILAKRSERQLYRERSFQ